MKNQPDQSSWGEVSRRLRGSAVNDTNLFSVTATAAPSILAALELRLGQRLLEVGSGRGDLLALARASGLDGIGLDLSPEMVELARTTHPGIDVRVGDARALPFEREQFAGVVCSFTLGFVPNRRVAVEEAARVLCPGGCYALTTWDMHTDGFLARVDTAVRRYGVAYRNVLHEMNPGPGYFTELLTSAGFHDVHAVPLPLYIRCADPTGVLSVLRTAGASRALVEAEGETARARIEAELVASMSPDDAGAVMPAPAVLVFGRKAAAAQS